MYPCGLVTAAEIRGAVIQPEGNVHSGDLLQPLFRGEASGKKGLALAKAEKRGLGVLLAGFEGDDAVGFQTAAETGGHDGGVFAVGAEGSGSILVAENFSAAGGTLKSAKGAFLILAELLRLFRLPLKFLGVLRFLTFVEGTDGVDVKGVAAVFAGQLLGVRPKVQTGVAAWAFVFQDAGLFLHGFLLQSFSQIL